MLRDHVHHAGREPGVGNDTDPLGAGRVVQLFLFLHDLRVATEVGEVHTSFDSESGECCVEVVRDRAHHRVTASEGRANGGFVTHIERNRHQTRIGALLQEGGQRAHLHVGQQHLRHRRLIQ